MMKKMNKLQRLTRMKRAALLLFVIVSTIFIITLLRPDGLWRNGVKAMAEAAMVGALADWFAIVALFRRVPLPFLSRHSAVIPRNQPQIANNLGQFVQEKFLDTPSLLTLLRRYDPARCAGRWLICPGNSQLLGQYLLQTGNGLLDVMDDSRIQHFMRAAVHTVIDKMDWSRSGAMVLDGLTKNNRHQILLDAAIRQILRLLKKPASRQFIATQLIRWLKKEHPLKSQLLPAEWLSKRGAELMANAVNTVLDDVGHNQQHELRQGFNRAVAVLTEKLKHDPLMIQQVETLRTWLKEDEALNRYIGEIWQDLRLWLKQDLRSKEGVMQRNITAAALWLGKTLCQDDVLRASFNQHIEQAVSNAGPGFSRFLTRHISDTVKSWDAAEMSRQIELNIGRDLQFIRINGTLVGGTIGLGLYLLSLLPGWISQWWPGCSFF